MEIEVKLYNWTWEFKKQINPKKIYSKISFQEELDSWQGDFSMTLEWSLNDFKTSDIIEIRDSVNWNLYTWIIEEIWIEEFKDSSILNIKFLWIFTVLNDIKYKSWWLRTFTKTDTVWNIIKNIIDSFNLDYGSLFWDTQILNTNIIKYTWSSIDITWSNVNIAFANDDCLSAIQKTIKNTWFNFYIWKDWVVYLTNKVNQDKKYITFEKEIISINRKLSKKDMVNKYYLTRDWGTELPYEDVIYQGLFWLKEKSETNSDIKDLTTQNTKWNEYIEENKAEDNVVSIKIKANSIVLKPWDIITTLNSRNNLIEKQITKIDIKKEYFEIYLWNFISFWKTIVKGN